MGLQQVIYGSGSCDSCQDEICEYKIPLRQQYLTKFANQIHYLLERSGSEIKKMILNIERAVLGWLKHLRQIFENMPLGESRLAVLDCDLNLSAGIRAVLDSTFMQNEPKGV